MPAIVRFRDIHDVVFIIQRYGFSVVNARWVSNEPPIV